MNAADPIIGWVHHLEHLLPAQRPIEAFVHHNTLHHLEDKPFHEGVEQAARTYRAEPYMPEAFFRTAWQEGRIQDRDVQAVVAEQVEDAQVTLGSQTLSLRWLVEQWMRDLAPGDGGSTLRWRLEETDELSAYPSGMARASFERLSSRGPAGRVQPALWRRILAHSPSRPEVSEPKRVRDVLLQSHREDTDAWVNPVLVRWCAAYLDGGQAYWPMTDKEDGFYRAMLLHLAQLGMVPARWMAPLTGRAQVLLSAETTPVACIRETLTRLGWPESRWHDMLEGALLSLPGWPGMFVALADRPDVASAPPPPTSVLDFLAIRLLLEEAAARAIAARPTGAFPTTPITREPTEHAAWILFGAARLAGVWPEEVDKTLVQELQTLVHRFNGVRRRWFWHLAFERRYRISLLDGLLNHTPPAAVTPAAQIVTCIDDREESLRRHVEELRPDVQTFGVAGFFGVAAYVKRLNTPEKRPLCPAPITPRHTVLELGDLHASVRAQGRVGQALAVGSNTLVRGAALSLWGWASMFPMVSSLLTPGLFSRFLLAPTHKPSTLALEHTGDFDAEGRQLGFKVEEMANIVKGTLELMGLTQGFAPLVVFLGHGSHSQNNPHEAGYNCGACAGGRGGVNARAYAIMANRPDVRALVATKGIEIPAGTWFLGGYHDTCDDEISTYDKDLVPASHQEALAEVLAVLDQARRLDAHERVRRFASAPLDLTPDQALRHVQIRSEDLAQPRPEYNHSGNASCLVGNRSWSRGLFLDRRAFLTSYDPAIDPDGAILERLLLAVGPVGAGINLEYYFSYVDRLKYGSDNKLPHNITSLVGVMDGHSSDLRTGLYWQMVEIHEPIRLLNVIEARPEQLLAILDRQPGLAQLILNRWILVAAFDASTRELWFLEESGFVPYVPESQTLPVVARSVDWYGGHREHLPMACVLQGAA